MTRVDNTEHLVRAAAARHQRALTRARAAIDALDRAGQPVTFTAVAREAGVARGWLYTQPELRDTITRKRVALPVAPSLPSAQRTTPASLRQRLDDTRHEITRLRAENALLRDQLARQLGDERARR